MVGRPVEVFVQVEGPDGKSALGQLKNQASAGRPCLAWSCGRTKTDLASIERVAGMTAAAHSQGPAGCASLAFTISVSRCLAPCTSRAVTTPKGFCPQRSSFGCHGRTRRASPCPSRVLKDYGRMPCNARCSASKPPRDDVGRSTFPIHERAHQGGTMIGLRSMARSAGVRRPLSTAMLQRCAKETPCCDRFANVQAAVRVETASTSNSLSCRSSSPPTVPSLQRSFGLDDG